MTFWPCLGDPAAPYVYGIHSNLGNTDSAIFDLARSWLLDCQDNHTQCTRGHSDFSPSRSLEVTVANGINSLRLFQCNGPPVAYAALSYCWGGEQPMKLVQANLNRYLGKIDEQALPQTIKDAVRVTREIGLRYLWIDAYCIVQDLKEDKVREISLMRQIYKYATVIISASRASLSNVGFLSAEPFANVLTLPVGLETGEIGMLKLRKYRLSSRFLLHLHLLGI